MRRRDHASPGREVRLIADDDVVTGQDERQRVGLERDAVGRGDGGSGENEQGEERGAHASTMASIGAVQKTRYIDLLSTSVDNAERAMDLNQIVVFEAVVREGSFTAAARALGQPKSTVSKRVAELEARLRARLLNRSTRRVAPTEEGALYYEHCRTRSEERRVGKGDGTRVLRGQQNNEHSV